MPQVRVKTASSELITILWSLPVRTLREKLEEEQFKHEARRSAVIVTIQLVQVAVRGAPGCTSFGGTNLTVPVYLRLLQIHVLVIIGECFRFILMVRNPLACRGACTSAPRRRGERAGIRVPPSHGERSRLPLHFK